MFCQNYEISHGGKGLEVSESELIDCMLYLQDIGAHNINLVTPSNYTNLLQTTLEKAKTMVNLPIVWNSSGYETVANLRKMQGLVDVYLPDFKYSDNALAWEYSHAKGYREVALAALEEMRRQQPKDVFDNDGMMQKASSSDISFAGQIENTVDALRDIASVDKSLYVSLMGQYFPTDNVKDHPTLSRRLTQDEYDKAIDAFFASGLCNGFSQELDSATEEYVPDFDLASVRAILENYKS